MTIAGNVAAGNAVAPVSDEILSTSKNEVHEQQEVKDTLELAEVIMATLERMALNVFHAPHGSRALEMFNELDPDVVLLDISLPDMTGWNIMDSLKERFENAPDAMPVIIFHPEKQLVFSNARIVYKHINLQVF